MRKYTPSEHFTKEENKEWNDLYQYVFKEIYGYDSNQTLPKEVILRLRGLRTGKYLNSTKEANKCKYSFKVILYTFQVYKNTILDAMRKITFKDDMHKINYICRIIESHLNELYVKVKNAEQTKEKINTLDTKAIESDKSDTNYKKKTEEVKNAKLNDLW